MSSTIIDETVILRYLLDDDEVLSPRAAKAIATRTARVYPEIITRVVVTLRDVYKVPRVEIAAAMKRLLDDVMVDEPTVIAFAINEGAYCAETMRGALESVPQGQLEAGYCVGMTWWQIMRRIVLPQALRTAVPALSNSLIGMIKDTSLASNITVAELFMAGQRVAARTYIFLPIYCEVAVVYLLFCTVVTKLQSLLERHLNAHGFQ